MKGTPNYIQVVCSFTKILEYLRAYDLSFSQLSL